jgi:hypothetical protein
MTTYEATPKNVCYTLPAGVCVEQRRGVSSPPQKIWKQFPGVSREVSAPDRAAERARFLLMHAAMSIAR